MEEVQGPASYWITDVQQLEAELTTISAWSFKPEASALTLGEAIMELESKLHGETKQLATAQEQLRSAHETMNKLGDRNTALKDEVARLRTYAQLLESGSPRDVMRFREALDLKDMNAWIIPKEHYKALETGE